MRVWEGRGPQVASSNEWGQEGWWSGRAGADREGKGKYERREHLGQWGGVKSRKV